MGTGPPIVLVHGTPYSSRIFSGIVPALAEHHEVFLFDHLGYGQSERREGQDLSIAAQSRRLARLLEHWRLDVFALMLKHTAVFEALPGYAHRALVAAHMRNATQLGFRPGVLEELLRPLGRP